MLGCALLFRTLVCGVPQGSIVFPVLFNICVKLLGEVIQIFGLGCHQYTDNTCFYLILPADPREDVETLNQCLELLLEWMQGHTLKLNPNMIGGLLVGRRVILDLRCYPFWCCTLLEETVL